MEPPSNNNLFLKILFVVLFLVLLGELLYILFVSKSKNNTNNVAFQSSTSIKIIDPTKSPQLSNPSSTLISEYQGKIINLNITNKKSISGKNNVEIYFVLEIGENKDKKIETFLLKEGEINEIKITDFLGKIVPYEALKIGQIIKVNSKYFEINRKPFISIGIEILK